MEVGKKFSFLSKDFKLFFIFLNGVKMWKTIVIALAIAIVSLAVVGLVANIGADLFKGKEGTVNAEIDNNMIVGGKVTEPNKLEMGNNNNELNGKVLVNKGGSVNAGSGAVIVNVNSCCSDKGCGEISVKDCGSCEVDYRFDPVCGKDGNTYINEYGAKMAGVEVAYKGYCENFKVIEPKKEENGKIGTIVNNKPNNEVECYDSDGGDNPKEAGYVKLGDTVMEDTCSLNGELTVQKEYFCKNGDIDSKEYFCQQGCTAGVCNEYFNAGSEISPSPEQGSCYDSDGDDKYTAGYVEVNGMKYYDSCSYTTQDNGEEVANGVMENVCENGQAVVKNYNCENGCYEGACSSGFTVIG